MIKTQVFPYFGGKSRVAAEVWRRFGVAENYLEPFAGSLAMALRNPRPDALKTETLNDFNGLVANFWRSVASDPDATASWADWPVSHLDLTARHKWLVDNAADLKQKLVSDPHFFDPKIAGWWVWGISQWVGSGWCDPKCGKLNKRPHLGDRGRGPHSMGQRPHLGNRGRGPHSMGQRPHLGDLSQEGFYGLYQKIAKRLRSARMTACDWESTRYETRSGGKWCVFLDPPYTAESGRDPTLYAEALDDSNHLSVGHDVARWAIEIGDEHRVALCGILGEYDIPESWDVFEWKTIGYSSAGRDRREVIWFSPACAQERQESLF